MALSDQATSRQDQEAQPPEDDESVYDIFAEVKFEEPTMQKCWLILGQIHYHFEATDFLEPITAETIGQETYDYYTSVIETPMDISTVMSRMQQHYYLDEAGGDSQ